MVVGDNRPFVAALITLEADGLRHWQRMHRKEGLRPDRLAADAELLAELQKAVDDANSSVSRAEPKGRGPAQVRGPLDTAGSGRDRAEPTGLVVTRPG